MNPGLFELLGPRFEVVDEAHRDEGRAGLYERTVDY
jgi:hypothetical protein